MPLQIHASDSQTGRTLTYSASGLPPGLSINSTSGSISGTPTTAGNYNATVTVTDNVGIQGKTNFAWSVTAAPQGNKSTVGASADTGVYGSGYAARAAFFDGNVGRPLAITSWKTYFPTPGTYPVTINNPHAIGTASNLGARVLISLKPLIDTTNSYTSSTYTNEKANLRAACQLLSNNNIDFDICFYNEMNNGGVGFTGTNGVGVAGWQAFWAFYAPVVRNNGGNLSWCPAITHGFPNAMPYFPTNPLPDKIHFDWYANDWYMHSITPVSYGIDAVATSNNIAVGIGEFGPSNDPTKFTPTHQQWTDFCNQQVIGYFGNTAPNATYPNGGRLRRNLANADIIYFTDVKSSTAIGAIMTNTDYKIPGLQAIYDALNA